MSREKEETGMAFIQNVGSIRHAMTVPLVMTLRCVTTIAVCALLGGFVWIVDADELCCSQPCDQIDETIYPEDEYQTVCGSIVGASNGDIAYEFVAVAGGVYRFTFCEGGAWANFNTTLSVQASGCTHYLVTNDDYCGYLSQVDFMALADTSYVVVIAGDGDAGEYCLAFRGPSSGTPTDVPGWGRLKSLFR